MNLMMRIKLLSGIKGVKRKALANTKPLQSKLEKKLFIALTPMTKTLIIRSMIKKTKKITMNTVKTDYNFEFNRTKFLFQYLN